MAEHCWVRLRSRVTRLLVRKKDGYLAFVEKTDPQKCCGNLFLNPHAALIMRDFRWRDYRQLNPDLVLDAELQARKHFIYQGYGEGRLIDPERLRRMDPSFYRHRYPELRLRDDWEARVHYSYSGYYEGRIANSVDEWLCETSLHIFQPGKVGSHSISAAVEGKYAGGALHLHWPTDISTNFPWSTLTYPDIVNRPRPQRLRVISAARDVVSYVISGAFQYMSTLELKWGQHPDSESVRAYLDATFEYNCEVLEKWFDHQFYCGMDVYAHDFDHERGFIRLENDVIKLFLYRVENLPELEQDIGRFLQMSDFRLQRTNGAESKKYWKDYCDVFNDYVISRPMLERLYSSRYMRFFFSEDERARKMDYWSRPRTIKPC